MAIKYNFKMSLTKTKWTIQNWQEIKLNFPFSTLAFSDDLWENRSERANMQYGVDKTFVHCLPLKENNGNSILFNRFLKDFA